MSEPTQKVAPNTATEYTVQPDEPWYHPHHIMHHGDKFLMGVAAIIAAYYSRKGYKAHKRKRISP